MKRVLECIATLIALALIVAALTATCATSRAQGTAHAICDGLDPADGSSFDAWAPEYNVFVDLRTYGQMVYINGGFPNTDYIATWHLMLALGGVAKDGDPLAGAKFTTDPMGYWEHLAKGTGELDSDERLGPGGYQAQALTHLSASVFNGASLPDADDSLFHFFRVVARQ